MFTAIMVTRLMVVTWLHRRRPAKFTIKVFKMRLVSFVPVGTKINFMRFRRFAAIVSLALIVGSAGLFFTKGLNFGIDFRGILLEVRTPDAVTWVNFEAN